MCISTNEIFLELVLGEILLFVAFKHCVMKETKVTEIIQYRISQNLKLLIAASNLKRFLGRPMGQSFNQKIRVAEPVPQNFILKIF